MAGGDDTDFLRIDRTAIGIDTDDRAIGSTANAGNFAILDNVHATIGCCAGIAPGHGVVPGGTAAPLQGRTDDRIAGVGREIDRRAEFLHLFRREPLIVDAVQPVGVDVALEHLNVVNIVRQHHHAARRIHHVVIEILAQALPELHRMFVDASGFRHRGSWNG